MISRSTIIKLLLLTVSLVGIYFALQVKLGEDALDMLPGTSLQGDFKLLQQLGMINRVFISLESEPDNVTASTTPNPELLSSAQILGEKLAKSPYFNEVFYRLPKGYEFQLAADLKNYLPLLADDHDLRRFETMMTPSRLREKLRQDYLALNSLAGLAMRQQIQQDPLGFTGVLLEKLTALRGGMQLTLHDGFFVSSDGNHCLLWVESNIPLTNSDNALLINQLLETGLSASLKTGVKARIIGPLPHTLANVKTIKSDLGKLLPIAIIALSLFLLLVLRDWRALLLVAMPFSAAPPAIALVAVVHGQVSAMALGFGIVLLGIGVDFAIHIYVGCRSEQSPGKISTDLRKALFMAFLTTITVFAVLLLSRVPAHRQMALLAIAGLSWALILAWQLTPALAGKVFNPAEHGVKLLGSDFLLNHSHQLRPLKLLIWLVILAAGVAVWPSLHYNGDLRALDVPSASIKDDELAFTATWGGDQEQAFIVAVASEQNKVLDINDRVYDILRQEDRMDGVQSLATLLPGSIRQEKNLAGWQDFWQARLTAFKPELERAAIASGFTAQAFQPFIDRLTTIPVFMEPGHLLDGPLRPFVTSLFRRVAEKNNTSAKNEKFLVASVVPNNKQNAAVIKRISLEIPEVTVLSNSRWRQQVESDLKSDILRLFSIAALLVIAICTMFFRRFRQVVAVLAPVTTSLAAMSLFVVLTGGELNIMHALMGIMVIGLSVDYGIFIVNACMTGVNSRAFMAVSICAISTLSGFGVLSFANHPALHALGITVLIGIGAAWPTALFITPVLLTLPGNGEQESL